jgi:hypothetical protein
MLTIGSVKATPILKIGQLPENQVNATKNCRHIEAVG